MIPLVQPSGTLSISGKRTHLSLAYVGSKGNLSVWAAAKLLKLVPMSGSCGGL